MKDWKTYAIIALAAWCAALTFKGKNDSPRDGFATEQYARKCAIATALRVYGPNGKDANGYRICELDNVVDDYGAEIDGVLSMTKEERDVIIRDAREKRKAAIEKMKARRVIGGLSTNSLNRPLFQKSKFAEEAERKRERRSMEYKLKRHEAKTTSPKMYERHVRFMAESLDDDEQYSPFTYTNRVKNLREDDAEFFADVQEYRRKHKKQ